MIKKSIINHFFGIIILVLYVFLAISSTATGGNATALDAFNAGANFGSSVLDSQTARLRQQNDQFLHQVNVNLNIESDNFIRSLSTRNDYRNFRNDWFNLRDRLYNRARQQNNAPYVLRNLQLMFSENDVRVLRIVGDIAPLRWIEDGSPGDSPTIPYRQLPN